MSSLVSQIYLFVVIVSPVDVWISLHLVSHRNLHMHQSILGLHSNNGTIVWRTTNCQIVVVAEIGRYHRLDLSLLLQCLRPSRTVRRWLTLGGRICLVPQVILHGGRPKEKIGRRTYGCCCCCYCVQRLVRTHQQYATVFLAQLVELVSERPSCWWLLPYHA